MAHMRCWFYHWGCQRNIPIERNILRMFISDATNCIGRYVSPTWGTFIPWKMIHINGTINTKVTWPLTTSNPNKLPGWDGLKIAMLNCMAIRICDQLQCDSGLWDIYWICMEWTSDQMNHNWGTNSWHWCPTMAQINWVYD